MHGLAHSFPTRRASDPGALELGVDIGSLDVVVLNGYPGTVAATWRRFGRAGRRQRASLGVLVANSQPLDQYVVRHPDFFADATPEPALIAPDQPLVLFDHIRCSALELPFESSDGYGQVDPGGYREARAETVVGLPAITLENGLAHSQPAQTGHSE